MFFQHADELAKFSRFRHHNTPPAQFFRHAILIEILTSDFETAISNC